MKDYNKLNENNKIDNKINNKKDNNNVVNSSASQKNDIIISCKINADSQLYRDFQKFLQENKNVKKSVFIRNALKNELQRYFKNAEEKENNKDYYNYYDEIILNDFNNNSVNNNSADAKEKENNNNNNNNKELNLQEIKRKVQIEKKLIELEHRVKLIEDCLF